ncbi:unnamed protein product, partial [Prorocentrum cordatum]
RRFSRGGARARASTAGRPSLPAAPLPRRPRARGPSAEAAAASTDPSLGLARPVWTGRACCRRTTPRGAFSA